MLQIKAIVKDSIWYKKVSRRICLPLPRRVLGASKTAIVEIQNVQKQHSRFTVRLDAAKNIHYIKKCFK